MGSMLAEGFHASRSLLGFRLQCSKGVDFMTVTSSFRRVGHSADGSTPDL